MKLGWRIIKRFILILLGSALRKVPGKIVLFFCLGDLHYNNRLKKERYVKTELTTKIASKIIALANTGDKAVGDTCGST